VLLGSRPLATFTVKHECRKWLREQWSGRCPRGLEVLRFRDNKNELPTTVTLHMFDFPKE
jgi:hypothetical protein